MSLLLEKNKKSLLNKIEHKRQQMLEISQIYGFGSEKTLKHSQELDILIVKYQKIVSTNVLDSDLDEKIKN